MFYFLALSTLPLSSTTSAASTVSTVSHSMLYSKAKCENVRQSYQDVGCCDSMPPQKPGWAGKICTSIVRGNYPTYDCPDFFYVAIGMRFSRDGSSVDVQFMKPWLNQSYYVHHRYDWSKFSTIIFQNYLVNRTLEDPHFLFGIPQSAPQHNMHPDMHDEKVAWMAALGYQINGIRFSTDFSRANLMNAADWRIDKTVKKFFSRFVPPHYFATFEDKMWIKDPYYLNVNGDLDEKYTKETYFVCK